MTKKQIEAKIAALTEEMNGYIAIMETLQTNLETITNTKSAFDEGTYASISAPYPLGGEADDDWAGENEVTADGMNNDTTSAVGTYDGDVETLMGEISQDISDLSEKIEELQEQISELQEALLTAPDEEPETSGGGGGGGTSYMDVM
ncbi:DUF5082 family protein [Butyrivibrio proteoclasticus]|uniref:DUF5082 family protein n=1 Tax=Butyrivibrio proteoclasticus TaxID=43305 RepID=UPI00047AA7B6|nr:DUF5082 family protein [Butyrivibrio proteoclasticus]